MAANLPLPEQIDEPEHPVLVSWGDEIVYWAKGKEKFRSVIRHLAPKFQAEFKTIESMQTRAKEIQLHIARGILSETEFQEWDRPNVGKSSTADEKKAAAKLKTAHQKRIYKGFSDLCHDIFGKTPTKFPKEKKEEPKEVQAPQEAEITSSIPVPMNAIMTAMTEIRRSGTAGVEYGLILYNWTTRTYEARDDKRELMDQYALTEDTTDPMGEPTKAQKAPAPMPVRTGTLILPPDYVTSDEENGALSLVTPMSGLSHEDPPPKDKCVLCNKACELIGQVDVDCCHARFHRACMLESFKTKYNNAKEITEVECPFCGAKHPLQWALDYVKE